MSQGFYGFPNILGLLRGTNLRLVGKTGATAGAGLAGGTTSGAPTSGQFDVGEAIIDQTGKVWICTTAGTPGTWTPVGATSGGSSANATSTGAAGSEPGSPSAGDLYFPTGSLYVERYDGAAWAPWAPLFACTKPPVLSNWTWVNQSTAVATDLAGGGIGLKYAGSDNGLHCLVKTAPATPYTVSAALLLTVGSAGQDDGGILFRQSSTGVIHKLAAGGTTPGYLSRKWTTATTFGASYTDYATVQGAQVGTLFLQISDDGTNRICRYSKDGVNYNAFSTVARTTDLTADQIGFFVRAAAYSALTLLSWVVA